LCSVQYRKSDSRAGLRDPYARNIHCSARLLANPIICRCNLKRCNGAHGALREVSDSGPRQVLPTGTCPTACEEGSHCSPVHPCACPTRTDSKQAVLQLDAVHTLAIPVDFGQATPWAAAQTYSGDSWRCCMPPHARRGSGVGAPAERRPVVPTGRLHAVALLSCPQLPLQDPGERGGLLARLLLVRMPLCLAPLAPDSCPARCTASFGAQRRHWLAPPQLPMPLLLRLPEDQHRGARPGGADPPGTSCVLRAASGAPAAWLPLISSRGAEPPRLPMYCTPSRAVLPFQALQKRHNTNCAPKAD
jgi:hypothetical protein